MPLTPYHVASGLLIGLPIRRWIHLPTLLITTALIADVEPIAVILGIIEGKAHGYSHTFLVGSLAGPAAGLAVYTLERRIGFLRAFHASLHLSQGSEGPLSYALAGILGWTLHVTLDALIYGDMKPLAPFISDHNPLYLLHAVSLLAVYLAYDVVLFAGLSLYAIHFFRASLAEGGPEPALFRTGVLAALMSLIAAPAEINVEDDLHSALAHAAPAATTFGLSGIALSALSLRLLSLLSTGELAAIASILSAIALLSLNRPLLSFEMFFALYVGVAVVLILMRRSLLRLETARAGKQGLGFVINLLIASWVATVLLVGVFMLVASLVLLLMKSFNFMTGLRGAPSH